MADGVAVHRRVVVGRIVAADQYVLGQYSACGLEQRDSFGSEDLDVVEDRGAGFFGGEHAVGSHSGVGKSQVCWKFISGSQKIRWNSGDTSSLAQYQLGSDLRAEVNRRRYLIDKAIHD